MTLAANENEPAWVDEVLDFWFGLPPEAWFQKSEAFDRECESRFRPTYDALARQSAGAIATSPRQALAAVIVLDQFSRNIFRDTPQAFAADPLARAVANLAIERGWDTGLSKEQRTFLYLPFEHSEDVGDQAKSVALFEALGDDFYLSFAVAHRDIVARFGRFPHRNAVLGRTSTAEETAFLQQPGSSF